MNEERVKTIDNFELLWVSMDYKSCNPMCAIRIIGGGLREVHSDSEMV